VIKKASGVLSRREMWKKVNTGEHRKRSREGLRGRMQEKRNDHLDTQQSKNLNYNC
jgi:hypothetical protein